MTTAPRSNGTDKAEKQRADLDQMQTARSGNKILPKCILSLLGNHNLTAFLIQF